MLDERGFDVWLVNPTGLARPDRRKSDVLDCQWLQQLMSLGLLTRSHRPDDSVCELRSHVRDRRRAIKDRSRCVQHMQKALQQMNVKLDSVISDLAGVTGMRIIEAIVSGERDCVTLARMKDGRIRASGEEIAASLLGNWRAEHVFALGQALASYRHYDAQIGELEERIVVCAVHLVCERRDGDDTGDGGAQRPERKVEDLRTSARSPWERTMQLCMWDLFGVDLTAVDGVGFETALSVLSECGSDFSKFSSSKGFCSWLKVVPNVNVSGGRRLSGAKSLGVQNAGQAFKVAAMTLRRCKGPLGDAHRRRCARMDAPRAIKASAHQLARIVYSMVTRGEEYREPELAQFEAKRVEKSLRKLQKQAVRLGMTLTVVDGDVSLSNQAVA